MLWVPEKVMSSGTVYFVEGTRDPRSNFNEISV